MSRDGLVPRWIGVLSPRRTPARITAAFGLAVAVIAAFVPLSEIAKLVNIGTLFAFLIVNVGVIVLRRTAPTWTARSACRGCRGSRSSAPRCAST